MGEVTGKGYQGNEEPGRLRHIECVGVGVLLLRRREGGGENGGARWIAGKRCREKV